MNRSHFIASLLSFLIKNPKAFLLALLLGGLSYSYEVFIARDTMVFQGVPKAIGSSLDTYTRIFRNRAYMVGYSDLKGNPLWVVYKLTPPSETTHHLKRPDSFNADWRTMGLVTSSDYTHSGYDREGHGSESCDCSFIGQRSARRDIFDDEYYPSKTNAKSKTLATP